MNWGWKITIVMVIYMVSIIAVVWYTMTLDVNLVADNYYQQELEYEDQITRLKNTEELLEKPTFEISNDGKYVILTFPESIKPEKGQVVLYRPSDFTKDRKFKMQLDEGNQQGFVVASMQTGLWRAKILWEMKGKSYYQEFVIVL